ncbi:hypothetical protein [Streptomyces kronopolitis]|uniref:hypothetical protein n=1 Tax=Streptomyces kronopolitis TaxID=1612435 RepID=UPI0034353897
MTEEAAQSHHGATRVQVQVSDCSAEDAEAVFSGLNSVFTSDRSRDDAPRPAEGERPIVWTATADVAQEPAEAEPLPLTAPVTVTLQGGRWAVDRLHAGLASVFSVQRVGTTAGDQEREAQLRLVTRPTAA